MDEKLKIKYLANHPELVPVIKKWFELQWPSYYGPMGPGDAEKDLYAYSNRSKLPVALIAFYDNIPCGVAALKPESISTHSHLSPWVSAGFVLQHFRGRGIGSHLLHVLEEEARKFDYSSIYCGSATAKGILVRSGWCLIDELIYNGKDLSIYQKTLQFKCNWQIKKGLPHTTGGIPY
jgi:GNAT superfamily N-acetyltransferase